MGKIKYVLIGALLASAFLMNPSKEQLYDRAILEESGIDLNLFKNIQYSIIEEVYVYENYYVCGILRAKNSGNTAYIGLFGRIFNLDK